MSAAARRWPALVAASLGLHLLALGALPGMFSRDVSTPLYVDLTTLDEPAPPETPERGPATSGDSRRQTNGGATAAPARRADVPLRAPRAPHPPSAPVPSTPPPPIPAPRPEPAPSPVPASSAPPAPSPLVPPAPGAESSGPVRATTPEESRPGAASGASVSRDAGQGSGTEVGDAGAGSSHSGSSGALLALARPGEGRGGVPPAYAPYLARFRQRVEEALVYPLAARRRGQGGRVELEVLLDPSGRVGRVAVAVSSDNAALDEAALAAVRAVEPTPFPSELPRRPLLVRLPLVFQLR